MSRMRRELFIIVPVVALHLGGQLLAAPRLADLTQVLLMPAVATVLWPRRGAAPRGRVVRWTLVALGFSWLGDTLPRALSPEASFLAMVGCFLLAQIVYCVAFWPWRARSVLTHPRLLVPYLLAAVLIVVLCAPAAGPLLPLIATYAAAIITMAVLATGLGRLAGAGAAVFVLSDALIALDAFGVLTLPAHAVWVMSTYVAAQLMLVLAVRRQAR